MAREGSANDSDSETRENDERDDLEAALLDRNEPRGSHFVEVLFLLPLLWPVQGEQVRRVVVLIKDLSDGLLDQVTHLHRAEMLHQPLFTNVPNEHTYTTVPSTRHF